MPTPASENRGSTRDQFLGLVSHELRSPIAVILGFAGRARRSEGVAEEVADALDEITRQAELLQQIIEDMLLLATAGAGHPICEPVLLQRELSRIASEHERLHPGIRVIVAAPEDLPPILAEPVYLQQLVRNLLSNATKYGGSHGPIWVAVNEQPGADSIDISVLDTGPGVPEEELVTVLQPFFRSASTAHLGGGVGLGLAVCKRLVEAQQGKMWLKNRPGGGLEAGFSLRKLPPETVDQ